MAETFADRVAYLDHAWQCGNRSHVLGTLNGGRMKSGTSRAMVAALMHRMVRNGREGDAADLAVQLTMRIGEASRDYLDAITPQER